jgi:trans-AT polyketide synthase/acyltransferase/oxidoreductase domain-containing protein
VGAALDEIEAALGKDGPAWGANLIHSPHNPELENVIADLYLSRGVRRICASAFMGLTPAVVRCAAKGLRRDSAGRIQRRHHIFAKLSRPEVAEAFMSPAPATLLEASGARRQAWRRGGRAGRPCPGGGRHYCRG